MNFTFYRRFEDVALICSGIWIMDHPKSLTNKYPIFEPKKHCIALKKVFDNLYWIFQNSTTYSHTFVCNKRMDALSALLYLWSWYNIKPFILVCLFHKTDLMCPPSPSGPYLGGSRPFGLMQVSNLGSHHQMNGESIKSGTRNILSMFFLKIMLDAWWLF